MYRLRVLNIPSQNVAEIVSDLPRVDQVLTLLQNWDGETFAFNNHRDAQHYRRILNDILRDASYQAGTPLPPPHWDADWDTFEIVVEVYKPDTGWRRLNED
jgi:hypothetical protein